MYDCILPIDNMIKCTVKTGKNSLVLIQNLQNKFKMLFAISPERYKLKDGDFFFIRYDEDKGTQIMVDEWIAEPGISHDDFVVIREKLV